MSWGTGEEVAVKACGPVVREVTSHGVRGSRRNQQPLFSVRVRKSCSLGRGERPNAAAVGPGGHGGAPATAAEGGLLGMDACAGADVTVGTITRGTDSVTSFCSCCSASGRILTVCRSLVKQTGF